MIIKKNNFLGALILLLSYSSHAQNTKWRAQWITAADCKNNVNTWLACRKQITVGKIPVQAIAKIAVDSKYWLWVNNKQVYKMLNIAALFQAKHAICLFL